MWEHENKLCPSFEDRPSFVCHHWNGNSPNELLLSSFSPGPWFISWLSLVAFVSPLWRSYVSCFNNNLVPLLFLSFYIWMLLFFWFIYVQSYGCSQVRDKWERKNRELKNVMYRYIYQYSWFQETSDCFPPFPFLLIFLIVGLGSRFLVGKTDFDHCIHKTNRPMLVSVGRRSFRSNFVHPSLLVNSSISGTIMDWSLFLLVAISCYCWKYDFVRISEVCAENGIMSLVLNIEPTCDFCAIGRKWSLLHRRSPNSVVQYAWVR